MTVRKGDRGRSHADGDVSIRPGMILGRCPKSLAQFQRAFHVRLRKDHRELLPAVARHEIADAGGIAQDAGEFLENLVPRRMAVGVVVLLEVIHVDHQQRGGSTGPLGEVQLDVELIQQRSPVHEFGQAVGGSQLEELGVGAFQLLSLLLHLVFDLFAFREVDDRAEHVEAI